MKKYMTFVCGLAPALSLGVVSAASPHRDQSLTLDFAVAPGMPIIKHESLQRYFTYSFKKGEMRDDVLAVINLSKTQPLTVTLHVSDATVSPTAGPVFSDAGPQHQMGQWITLSQTKVIVAPYHVQLVPMAVRIPSSVAAGAYEGSITATSDQTTVITSGRFHSTIRGARRCLVYIRLTS